MKPPLHGATAGYYDHPFFELDRDLTLWNPRAMRVMDINPSRLRKTLQEINRAALNDKGGIDRLALSDADKLGRDLLADWMKEIGLDIRVDDIGTMYGRYPGSESDHPVVFGSHLDSVPNGGRFDGALGVVVGLEIMRVLREHDMLTRRPLELVNFSNEEGARFEPAMMASGVLAGQFTAEFVHNRKDRRGVLFRDELARIGYMGHEENRLRNVHAFLELHVEQGPVLESNESPVAIVEGIQGITWLGVKVYGESDHAGPTPMKYRRDALVAAARIISGVQAVAERFGQAAVGTVGRIEANPGIINVIPGEVNLSVDVRHPDREVLATMEAEVRHMASEVAEEQGVDVSVEHIWTSPPTALDQGIVQAFETNAEDQGVKYHRMISGAGHDAKYMAEIAPTGMLFVRSLGGKSHSPEEESEWADIFQAARVMLHTVLYLAQQD